MRHGRHIVPLLVFCLGSSAAPAPANPITPPDTPRERHVKVALANGVELSGTLLQLSPAAVALLVNGARQEYRLDDVARVESMGDSLANGAILGAAVVGGLCLVVCGQGLDDSGDVFGVALVNAGLGALVGMGIDRLHSDRTILYDRARSPHSTGRGVRPSLSFRVRF